MSLHLTKSARRLVTVSTLTLIGLPGVASAEGDIIVTGARAPAPLAQPFTASPEAIRLETIGFRLASANGDKCEKPEMLSGMIVHDISDYDAKERPDIIAKTRMSYGFGVTAIVPGSPANEVGLQVGDEIIGINGATLRDGIYDQLPSRGTFTRIEGFNTNLTTQMKYGTVALKVLRAGSQINLAIKGVPGCGGRFSLQASNQLNAWSDGRYVAITPKMMNFTSNDDELAFVLAHEMAHNILNHAIALRSRSALLASFGFGAGKFYKTEAEADDFAVTLLASARTDLKAPSKLLTRFLPYSFWYMSPTHPSFGTRIAIVETAIERQASLAPKLAKQPDVMLASNAPNGLSLPCSASVESNGASSACKIVALSLPKVSISLGLANASRLAQAGDLGRISRLPEYSLVNVEKTAPQNQNPPTSYKLAGGLENQKLA